MLALFFACLQSSGARVLGFVHTCARRLRCCCSYRLEVHSPRAVCAAVRAEVELLLTASHGPLDHAPLFSDCDRLYTATYRKQTVACVFTRSIDWSAEEGAHHIRNVRALSVLPGHRRLGLATRLLARIKRDAARERAVWLELHVDEKRDRSHECLLAMYRKMGFLVLPRPERSEYILLCMDY